METIKIVEKISVGEFRNMYFEDSEGYYYELMDGEIIKRSAPATNHQRISRKLLVAINAFAEVKKLGEVFYSPMDVWLDDYNQLQPDLVFVSAAQQHIIIPEGIKGIPELVIEILSPSSVMRDRIGKKRIYQQNGVLEYWLVSPEYAEIEVFVLENGRYELYSAATVLEGELRSKVLEGLNLNFMEIFNT